MVALGGGVIVLMAARLFWVARRVLVGFFKQKTAYGISECDWSSDVCSSD
eukprot:COSAG06_NODE_27216_length_598_cov_0.615230_1_plen_49_part_10